MNSLTLLVGNRDVELSKLMPRGYRCTLQQVADHMGISRQRVEQIEQRAIGKLKRLLKSDEPDHVKPVEPMPAPPPKAPKMAVQSMRLLKIRRPGIVQTLELCDYDFAETARLLRISVSELQKLIHFHNVELPSAGSEGGAV